MDKAINFADAKATRFALPLASGYTIFHPDENGKMMAVHEFDGDELIGTTCPGCGIGHDMPLDDFFKVAGEDFDLYGTRLYCPTCSDRRKKP